ncbi:hypothetical protein FH972_023631 [Carpinus fangiana]|uniref:Uncharacterized protein n=1 Tax=Carpinus fangiana TaxID=176857 RepID=A0A5N6KW85_9ROSI|nr:hypothetical protein FH972_023631 [Carpinus fangiana]
MDDRQTWTREDKPSGEQHRHPPAPKLYQGLERVPIENHVMGGSLFEYVASKVHLDITRGQLRRINIRGRYIRDPPTIVSAGEKTGKRFNYQRPTITTVDDSSIYLDCFPGRDYVQHYMALVTSYYNLTTRVIPVIQYALPPQDAGMNLYLKSNLVSMGSVNTIIVGYVQHFEHLAHGAWENGSGADVKLFAWKMIREDQGRNAALLGCMTSVWGDLAGQLIQALQQLNKVKCVLYIGKAGTLSPEYEPNQFIATGSSSFLGDEPITWSNPFQSYLRLSPRIREGNHVTVVSPLIESKSWLIDWQTNCSWVDCEVGYMANSSNLGDTQFGYLHIVSDNIAVKFPYDLTDERAEAVLHDRSVCFGEIEIVLRAFLAMPSYAEVAAQPKLMKDDIDQLHSSD